MSTVLPPQPRFEPLDGLPLIEEFADAAALNSRFRAGTTVKWPNDVVFRGRKPGGTIVQGTSSGNALPYAPLGPGLNANFSRALLAGEVEDANSP